MAPFGEQQSAALAIQERGMTLLREPAGAPTAPRTEVSWTEIQVSKKVVEMKLWIVVKSLSRGPPCFGSPLQKGHVFLPSGHKGSSVGSFIAGKVDHLQRRQGQE